MNFIKKDVKLVKMRSYTKVKEDGTERIFHFVSIADKKTYENVEFILNDATNPKTVEVEHDYDATLVVDGRFSSVRLDPIGAGVPR
jgi:hypothetical protein